MPAITVTCPACHDSFKVSEHDIGQQAKCPNCGQRLIVGSPHLPIAAPIPLQVTFNKAFDPQILSPRGRHDRRPATAANSAAAIVTVFAAVVLLCCTGLVLMSQRPTVAPSNAKVPAYRILSKEPGSIASQTRITYTLLVWGEMNAAGLEHLLKSLHESISRQSYRSVFIRAYTDEERATNGGGQWVAMLSRSGYSSTPEVEFNRYELTSRLIPPETKFGMDESTRRQLRQQNIRDVDYRAYDESLEAYPLGKTNVTENENWKLGSKLQVELKEKYQAEFLREHGLTEAQWSEIETEALGEDWTVPSHKQNKERQRDRQSHESLY